MTTSLRDNLRERIDELKTLRDQIRVDLKLAGMELRGEWRELEKRMPDASRLVGVVTDRDACMSAYMQGQRLDQIAVGTAMSRELYTCVATATFAEVEQIMTAHQVRRLPVVDENGRLVGMVTLADLARRMAGSRADAGADAAAWRSLGATFAGIVAPRRSSDR